MEKKLSIDSYSRTQLCERDLCEQLYRNPKFDYSAAELKSAAQYNMAVDSSLRAPTKAQPIARLYGKNTANRYLIQFSPILDKVGMIYVRKPKVAKWGYVIDPVYQIETYDSASSQDIELPESMFDTLRFMMLKRLGVPEREAELYKYGQDLQQRGV